MDLDSLLDPLLESQAILHLGGLGMNPLEIAEVLHVQPVRVRSILEAGGGSTMEDPRPLSEASKERKGPLGTSTWKTKLVATVAVLASFHYGADTIASMIKKPETEVRAIIASQPAQEMIKRLEQRPTRRRSAPRVPASMRRKAQPTQEQVYLARIIFAEAADQSRAGKEAVAQVILNRVKHRRYPADITSVITQRSQFSAYPSSRLWKMSGDTSKMNRIQQRAWKESFVVAQAATQGKLPNRIGSATLYHDTSITLKQTGWDPSVIQKVANLGAFHFYVER